MGRLRVERRTTYMRHRGLGSCSTQLSFLPAFLVGSLERYVVLVPGKLSCVIFTAALLHLVRLEEYS